MASTSHFPVRCWWLQDAATEDSDTLEDVSQFFRVGPFAYRWPDPPATRSVMPTETCLEPTNVFGAAKGRLAKPRMLDPYMFPSAGGPGCSLVTPDCTVHAMG
jgi:hypothetical protein